MKRLLPAALLALAVSIAAPDTAPAKGLAASVQGATVNGLPYRYVAISPDLPYRASPGRLPGFTVVERIDKRGGRVGRWWHLPERYSIPAAADDDRSGGLSADGGTLVLSRFSWIYPPRSTGLAILDTHLQLRHLSKGGKHRPKHAIRRVDLSGSFSFDAVSPDGSTVYLIHHLSPYYGGPYEVRALDTRSGKLLPEPIVAPSEPGERMDGTPLSRTTSPDGRWAYTLYSDHERGRYDRAHEPFIHALDTVAGRAVCIDLPQLEGHPTSFALALRVSSQGRQLAVLDGQPGREGSRALLEVDTRSFGVRRPAPVATASSGLGPWPPIAVLCTAAAVVATWIGARRRRGDRDRTAERG